MSTRKHKGKVEDAGKVFFATRKHEMENYLCPDLIEEMIDVTVTFVGTCDAGKITGQTTGMRSDNVPNEF